MSDLGLSNDDGGPEILALADAYLRDDLSDELVQRLDELLQTDPEARRQYVNYLQDSYHLHRFATHALSNEKSNERRITTEDVRIRPVVTVAPTGFWPRTVGFFSEGMPLGYLVSTVVCALGIWILALIPVHHYIQVARNETASHETGSHETGTRSLEQQGTTDVLRKTEPANPSFVGRIASMVDCRWKKRPEIRGQKSEVGGRRMPVALGDTFELASGCMELIYDSGASVVLQGPTTYQVDSPDGGFLSVGKLTARVEQGPRSKVQGPKTAVSSPEPPAPNPYSNPPLSTTHSPLFTVKTPTATVTDLGTEFGVDVAASGVCEVHVLEGRVKAEWTSNTGVQGDAILLAGNEAVRLDPAQPQLTSITADTRRFKNIRAGLARTPPLLWPILHKTLVAWVSLDNLEQQGVGVLSIVNMPEFDGIVFGEIERGRWMAGSHLYQRTQQEQSDYPAEASAPGELVQIAIVYDWTQITIYRNGVKYAEYDAGSRQVFKKDSIFLMGKRHLPDEVSSLPTLVGAIEEARFYNFALSPEMIAGLKPDEPSRIGPVGWWTFEDGTALDVTGHFPMGELLGNARINDGKLILDGADSYLRVPAAEQPSKQPSIVAELNPKSHNASQ